MFAKWNQKFPPQSDKQQHDKMVNVLICKVAFLFEVRQGAAQDMSGNLFPSLWDSLDQSSPAQTADGRYPEHDGSRGVPIAALSCYKLSYVK